MIACMRELGIERGGGVVKGCEEKAVLDLWQPRMVSAGDGFPPQMFTTHGEHQHQPLGRMKGKVLPLSVVSKRAI